MSPIAYPFVIIMNDDLERSFLQLRVVHRDPTLADARLRIRYSSVIASYPRDHFKAALMEAKALVHAPSGIVKWGAIYKLSEHPSRVRARRISLPAASSRGRLKAHASPPARKGAGPSSGTSAPSVIGRIGKPGLRRAFAPSAGEKPAAAAKRRKVRA